MAVPIGPYEPKTAARTASNAESSLRALEKLGLEVSIEETAAENVENISQPGRSRLEVVMISRRRYDYESKNAAGFGRPDMNALMRQAQKMQEDMKAKQAEAGSCRGIPALLRARWSPCG